MSFLLVRDHRKNSKINMLAFFRFFQWWVGKFIIIIRWVTAFGTSSRHRMTLPVIWLVLSGSSSIVREGSCIFSGPSVTFATSFGDADDDCDDDDDQKNSKCNWKTDNQPKIVRIPWCHVTYTRTVKMGFANPYLQQTNLEFQLTGNFGEDGE